MIKNNYHTHTKYCNHALGDVEDYVVSAIEYGLTELGMTDHAPIPESFMSKEEYLDNWCDENMTWDIAKMYLDKVETAKIKYKDKIKIYSGFETEFLLEQLPYYQKLREQVDYLNLGIHYFSDGNGKILNTYTDVNYNNVHLYVKTAIDGMKSGLFNTLVHPDLFIYAYKNKDGERRFDEVAIQATKDICEAAIKYNVYLEVNANGIFNSHRDGLMFQDEWLYPWKEFWNIAKRYKELKIIIGSDAHRPDAIANSYVQLACEFCDNLGLNILEKMEINH